MARTVGMEALEQKIEKAQERVIRAKAAYNEAVNDLQKLLDKKGGAGGTGNRKGGHKQQKILC